MKVKCYSVRLEALVGISDRAYKAVGFDGSTAIIPKSQVFGQDYDVMKSEAFWISEWILEKKSIQYSTKKVAWFDRDSKKMIPTFITKKHVPDKVVPVENNEIKELKK
jgi:hypothetical protein